MVRGSPATTNPYRCSNPADRRAELVQPTLAGRDVIAIAQSCAPELAAHMAAAVGDGRLHEFRHDLGAVRSAARHLHETTG